MLTVSFSWPKAALEKRRKALATRTSRGIRAVFSPIPQECTNGTEAACYFLDNPAPPGSAARPHVDAEEAAGREHRRRVQRQEILRQRNRKLRRRRELRRHLPERGIEVG